MALQLRYFIDLNFFIKMIPMAVLRLYLSHDGHSFEYFSKCSITLSIPGAGIPEIERGLIPDANKEFRTGRSGCCPRQ